MRVPHDVEPLVGGGLAVAVQQLADAIDEDLRAAAGNAVEARGNQPLDDFRHRQLRRARNVQHLRRRQRVQLEIGKPLLHRPEQIFVPRERQVGIVPALQQQLHAAQRARLFDLLEDLVEAEHVAFAVPDLAVERAEVAARHADVGVVDVAVDDVGDEAVRVLPPPHAVGHAAEPIGRRVAIQLQRLVCREPAAGMRFAVRKRFRSMRLFDRSEAACRSRTRPELDRQLVKAPQAGHLAVAQPVFEIITQVTAATAARDGVAAADLRRRCPRRCATPRSRASCSAAHCAGVAAPGRPTHIAYTNGRPVMRLPLGAQIDLGDAVLRRIDRKRRIADHAAPHRRAPAWPRGRAPRA